MKPSVQTCLSKIYVNIESTVKCHLYCESFHPSENSQMYATMFHLLLYSLFHLPLNVMPPLTSESAKFVINFEVAEDK